MSNRSFLCPPRRVPLFHSRHWFKHEGSLDRAIELISLAKESGADAVKFSITKRRLYIGKVLKY